MTTLKDIKIALDVKLSELSGTTPVAWENINYKPVLGMMYIRPTLLFSNSTKLDFDETHLIQGIYQIDVFAPVNMGMGVHIDKLDDILDLFKGAVLVNNSTTVYINAVSASRFSTEQDWIVNSISVAFSVYK